MIMKSKDFEGAKSLKKHYEDFHNPPLRLTDRDKIPIGELPDWVKKGLNLKKLNLKSNDEVFFKKRGKQWVLALKSDDL